MPSTITSFTTFISGTKAKSGEVNANFDNFRGTRVPINPDSVSASDLTHDLGTDKHRWNVGYVGSIDFETSTTTSTTVLQGQTANTDGALELVIEGITVGVWGRSTGHDFNVETTTSVFSWKIKGDTVAVFNLNSNKGFTHTAGINGVARSDTHSSTFITLTGTAALVTGLSCTLTTIGRPVFVGLITTDNAANSGLILKVTTGASSVVDIHLVTDGATSTNDAHELFSVGNLGNQFKFPVTSVSWLRSLAAGTYKFEINISPGADTTLQVFAARLVAYEI